MPRTVIISAKTEYTMFCRWLKAKMIEKNVNQKTLEEYLGLSHSAFNHRLNEVGNSKWELMDYLKCLDYFGAEPNDIFK